MFAVLLFSETIRGKLTFCFLNILYFLYRSRNVMFQRPAMKHRINVIPAVCQSLMADVGKWLL